MHHFLICCHSVPYSYSYSFMITFYASFIDYAFDYILMFSQSLDICTLSISVTIQSKDMVVPHRSNATDSREAMQIMSNFSLFIDSNSFRFKLFVKSFSSCSLRLGCAKGQKRITEIVNWQTIHVRKITCKPILYSLTLLKTASLVISCCELEWCNVDTDYYSLLAIILFSIRLL